MSHSFADSDQQLGIYSNFYYARILSRAFSTSLGQKSRSWYAFANCEILSLCFIRLSRDSITKVGLLCCLSLSLHLVGKWAAEQFLLRWQLAELYAVDLTSYIETCCDVTRSHLNPVASGWLIQSETQRDWTNWLAVFFFEHQLSSAINKTSSSCFFSLSPQNYYSLFIRRNFLWMGFCNRGR